MGDTYLLDGEPVDWQTLIRKAERLDYEFADEWYKTTSEASRILRQNGHTVEEAS